MEGRVLIIDDEPAVTKGFAHLLMTVRRALDKINLERQVSVLDRSLAATLETRLGKSAAMARVIAELKPPGFSPAGQNQKISVGIASALNPGRSTPPALCRPDPPA